RRPAPARRPRRHAARARGSVAAASRRPADARACARLGYARSCPYFNDRLRAIPSADQAEERIQARLGGRVGAGLGGESQPALRTEGAATLQPQRTGQRLDAEVGLPAPADDLDAVAAQRPD